MLIAVVARREPPALALSLTHEFIETQTDTSDAFGPDLCSEDEGKKRTER